MFAALNTANGEVYGLCQEKHRHQEWLEFLRMIDKAVAAYKQIHWTSLQGRFSGSICSLPGHDSRISIQIRAVLRRSLPLSGIFVHPFP